jgi:hypothetical protein
MQSSENWLNPKSRSSKVSLLKKLVPFSVFLFIFGMVVAIFIGTITNTLKCQRIKSAKLSCQLSRSYLFQSKDITLDRLLQASIEVNKRYDPDEGESETYRIVLHDISGQVFFTGNYSSHYSFTINKENVYKINSFIKNPTQTSLAIQEDVHLAAYGAGGFCAFLGIIGIIYSLLLQNKDYEN